MHCASSHCIAESETKWWPVRKGQKVCGWSGDWNFMRKQSHSQLNAAGIIAAFKSCWTCIRSTGTQHKRENLTTVTATLAYRRWRLRFCDVTYPINSWIEFVEQINCMGLKVTMKYRKQFPRQFRSKPQLECGVRRKLDLLSLIVIDIDAWNCVGNRPVFISRWSSTRKAHLMWNKSIRLMAIFRWSIEQENCMDRLITKISYLWRKYPGSNTFGDHKGSSSNFLLRQSNMISDLAG